ncbi:MAG: type II toxin-antitoxin system ParD family antitoxin [Acidobacteria bacterium]|nr:type II toxin-antitoxin system ParD family antitoxin [Acidobacteriota bacterium]
MPTRKVDLTKHLDRFITRVVVSGEYRNESEVVLEGLRLVEERRREQRKKLRWLRQAAAVGIREIESGQYTEVRSRKELNALLRSLTT